MGIIRLHLVQFTEVKNSGTPVRKLGGIFGDSGLLGVTFRYWRYDRCENEKVLQHREIRGLQGVKVVSAEGIEPATY